MYGHSSGGGQVAWLSGTPRARPPFHPEPGLGSRAVAVCLPLTIPGWCSHEQALFYPVASFMPTDAGRGHPQSGRPVLCPLSHPCTEEASPDAENALIPLSAALAPVFIAVSVLQHFTPGKEPTLMVPHWQGRAVKQRAICCLVSTGVCACVSVHTPVCVVHCHVCMACACIWVPSLCV